MSRTDKHYSYQSNIETIRAVEDCIRATKKYTEALSRAKHPIQGEDFNSKVFCKHYEVYPTVENVSWDMPVGVAIDICLQNVPCVDVVFRYDYRYNKASVTIHDGNDAINKLYLAVPRFAYLIAGLEAGAENEGSNGISKQCAVAGVVSTQDHILH